MDHLNHLLILIAGFAAGWFAHALRERRKSPRKRSRAIPRGTEPKKAPGRPRKALLTQGQPLPLETETLGNP